LPASITTLAQPAASVLPQVSENGSPQTSSVAPASTDPPAVLNTASTATGEHASAASATGSTVVAPVLPLTLPNEDHAIPSLEPAQAGGLTNFVSAGSGPGPEFVFLGNEPIPKSTTAR
jgi:hypothetical protein